MPEPYEIIIGQTTGQDLLLDLGPPLRKFWKEDDRMERIWGRADTKLEDGECECESRSVGPRAFESLPHTTHSRPTPH
jgi:hypothetical protein